MQFPWGLEMAPRGEITEVCELLVLIASIFHSFSLPLLDFYKPSISGVMDITSRLSKAGSLAASPSLSS